MASDRLSLQKAKGPKGAFEKGLLLELTKLGPKADTSDPGRGNGRTIAESAPVVEHRITERFQRRFLGSEGSI